MTDYNATIELGTRADDSTLADVLIDALPEYGPAVGRAERGWVTLHITFPATGLRQAFTTALALVEGATDVPIVAVEVLPTEEFDARNGLLPAPPETVGVPEAAELLGVSAQAVRQRITSGSLPARRVGRDWRIQRAAVEAARRP